MRSLPPLPLFSPSSSFVPTGTASLAQPVDRQPAADTPRPRIVTQLPLWSAASSPVLRSLFDAIPAPAAAPPRRPADGRRDVRGDIRTDHRRDDRRDGTIDARTDVRRASAGPAAPSTLLRSSPPNRAADHAADRSAAAAAGPSSAVPLDRGDAPANHGAAVGRHDEPAVAPGFATRSARTPHDPPPAAATARVAASPRTETPVDRTEAALRDAGLAGRFWRGDALSVSPLPSAPSGFRALDEELPGGGWPQRCLTELLLTQTGIGEIRFLAGTLAALTAADREVVLLAPPHVPDPTGWEQLGIDMRRVLVVRTPRPADRLWAIEQSLKSSAFGALVAWLPEEKMLARHDVLRRLQSLASSANGLTFLMRPAIAEDRPSPATLRLALAVGRPQGDRRTLSVRLLKRRGPVLARPLTLVLPEIHRGMKTFVRTADDVPLADPSCVVPTTAATVSPSPIPIAANALARALLPDAVA